MEEKNHKHLMKVNAMARLLELIDGVNQDIEYSKALGNALLLRQYVHLKKDYTQQLLELLEAYHLPIHLDEAA